MKSKHVCMLVIVMMALTTITSIACVSEKNHQEGIPLFTIQESISEDIIENAIDPLTKSMDTLDQQSTKSDNVKKIGASGEELAQSFRPT